LKAGVPGGEYTAEIDALRHFDGQGTALLIDADADAGAILLEKLEPGKAVRSVTDDSLATSIFAKVARRLKKAAPDSNRFPKAVDWAKGFTRFRDSFDGTSGPLPSATLDRAARMMSELIGSMSRLVVLHGDLHHWNILSAEREPWLSLDPKGVVAEPEYEMGAWLRNPYPEILKRPDLKAITERRVDQLVDELGYDRQRILSWGYTQAVLAAIWSFEEDSASWKDEIAGAQVIGSLLQTRK
jgi:streptomycin 6-kinase